jgi:hypothetical protein
MFGESVFGGTPLGITFEAGVDSSGAHASTSGGGGSVSTPDCPPGMTCGAGAGLRPSTSPFQNQITLRQPTGPAPQPMFINPALLFKPGTAPLAMPRQASYTPPAGLGKPFPWLWVGLGVLVLGGAGYWYYSKHKKAA